MDKRVGETYCGTPDYRGKGYLHRIGDGVTVTTVHDYKSAAAQKP